MKHILYIITLILIASTNSYSQKLGGKNSTVEVLGALQADSALCLPVIDTTKAPYSKGNGPYLFGLNKADSVPVYYYRGHWVETAAGGGTSSIVVGSSITGGASNSVLFQNSVNALAVSANFTYDGGQNFAVPNITSSTVSMNDAGGFAKISTGSTNGTTIGTLGQKLAFFNENPVVQPSGDIGVALTNLGLITAPTLSAVTSITAGTGLSGGTITTTGTISVGTNIPTDTVTITQNALTTNIIPGLILQNTTAATSGSREQDPPSLAMFGKYYSVGVSYSSGFEINQTKASGSNNQYPVLHFPYTINNGTTLTDALTITTSSSGVTGSSVVAGGNLSANSITSNTSLVANTVLAVAGTQVVVNGSTSGTATFNQPEGGNYKVVIIYCSSLVGTATYAIPYAFSFTPQIVTTDGPPSSIVTSLSTSSITLTGVTTTGFIELIGY